MKPFCGGQLLDKKYSPFDFKLSHNQCIQYALDIDPVVSVLAGFRNYYDVKVVLSYLNSTTAEKDYSILFNNDIPTFQMNCVYCQHCQPCPENIDIALIIKYYRLSILRDELANSHYYSLNKKASNCIDCKKCDEQCPFKIQPSLQMKKHLNILANKHISK